MHLEHASVEEWRPAALDAPVRCVTQTARVHRNVFVRYSTAERINRAALLLHHDPSPSPPSLRLPDPSRAPSLLPAEALAMAIISYLFNWTRYVLAQGMHVVFAPDVRRNPAVVHSEVQSDDFTGGGRGARHKEQQRRAGGPFKPQYVAPLRPPRNNVEAQRLYNHVRTLAFYLDAIPFLGRRLPFNVGIDSILGVIPVVGDYIGLLLSLYALALSALFGLPLPLLGMMLFNILLDCVLGLIPVIGDALDVAWKSNLRNLRLLEEHLIKTNGRCGAGAFDFHFPPTNIFMPPEAQAAHPASIPAIPAEAGDGIPPGGFRRSTRLQATEAPADATAGRLTSLLPDGKPRARWASTAGSQ